MCFWLIQHALHMEALIYGSKWMFSFFFSLSLYFEHFAMGNARSLACAHCISVYDSWLSQRQFSINE